MNVTLTVIARKDLLQQYEWSCSGKDSRNTNQRYYYYRSNTSTYHKSRSPDSSSSARKSRSYVCCSKGYYINYWRRIIAKDDEFSRVK